MEMLWSSDSCDCKIIVNENFDFLDWIEKCFIHKNMNNRALIIAVQTHNIGFNEARGTNFEKRENKFKETNRIRSLGDSIKK